MYRAAQLVGEAWGESEARPRRHRGAGPRCRRHPHHARPPKGRRASPLPDLFGRQFHRSREDTPYLQIGENKYGKPILDRVIRSENTVDEAIKAALVSMNSTIRSNLAVGMPLDLAVIPVDEFHAHAQRIESDHKEFRQISDSWAQSLRTAFHALPSIKIT